MHQLIQLQTNRKRALQYVHIVGDLLGIIPDTYIEKDDMVIKEEKKMIADAVGVKNFRSLCINSKHYKVEAITPTIDDFDTSLEHSAFNIEIEEADQRGEQFFQDYLKFHKIDLSQKEVVKVKNKKKEMILPEINFDDWD